MAVARSYMDLSSEHRLEAVYVLFRPDGTYRSDALGTTCSGLPAIQAMMGPFFARYLDVRWHVAAMEPVPLAPEDQGGPLASCTRVEVHFRRTWTDDAGGWNDRTGKEWIYVDPLGSIAHVHVARMDEPPA